MTVKFHLLALAVCLMTGCVTASKKTGETALPSWLSSVQAHPELRGIAVHISPEVMGAEKHFSLQRPYEVNYVFKDGSIHVMTFDFRGAKVEDRWTSLKELPFEEDDILSVNEWRQRINASAKK